MGCNSKGERGKGEHDENPEEGQDVQGGLVDQAKDGLGHQLNLQPEETYDGEDLLQAQ